MEKILERLEVRFGRFAIPGILRGVALLQALVYVLVVFGKKDFITILSLDSAAILRGEVWRLVSFLFIPRTMSPLWILFTLLFLFFISRRLEEAWGAFRLNLFVFSSVIFLNIAAFLIQPFTIAHVLGMTGGELFYISLFLVLACVYPNEQVLLIVFPIRMKFLALLPLFYLTMLLLSAPLIGKTVVLLSQATLLFFVLPGFFQRLKQDQKAKKRRVDYAKKSLPADEAFHKCASCGKTDERDPELEFRIDEDGKEYCEECLKEEG